MPTPVTTMPRPWVTFGQPFEHILGQEFIGLPDEMRRVLDLQLVDAPAPVDMDVGLDFGQQLTQDRLQVADHARGGLDVFIDF